MLAADRLAIRAALSNALLGQLGPAAACTMTAPPSLATRSSPGTREPDAAPALARDVVRTFAAAAIGVNIALSLIDVWRLVYVPLPASVIRAAAMFIAVAIPLHIRHVIYGLRGERPPAGVWTLIALAIINAFAAEVVGSAWSFQFASLVVSILIVVPGAWGVVLAAGVVMWPIIIAGPYWYADHPTFAGIYLAFAVVWRATTQYVPLRLVAAIRALDVAGRELESRAVVQARVRIDAELSTGVTGALEQIVARGELAKGAAARDPERAIAELQELVRDSRRTLARARRVVSGYRNSSARSELDAAAALLEATGASVRIIAADGLALDLPDAEARGTIRAAVATALREEPNARYRVEVARDAGGALSVAVSADDDPDAPPGVDR
jgi:two-component system sensor histidine kinase DesK